MEEKYRFSEGSFFLMQGYQGQSQSAFLYHRARTEEISDRYAPLGSARLWSYRQRQDIDKFTCNSLRQSFCPPSDMVVTEP